jgi:WD repeat-containing protein 7
VSTLSLDLETFITEATTITKSISTSRDQTKAILSVRDHLRSVLGTLLTPGLNVDIDMVCDEDLGIPLGAATRGFSQYVFYFFMERSYP